MSRKSACNAIRRQIWRSMRIMRKFTQPEILRTVPNATENNVGKYFHLLARHGFIKKVGPAPSRQPGNFQAYQLVRDTGPVHPNRCDRCGEPLTAKECKTKEEREKEKERETEKEAASLTSCTSLESLPSDPPEVTHDAA